MPPKLRYLFKIKCRQQEMTPFFKELLLSNTDVCRYILKGNRVLLKKRGVKFAAQMRWLRSAGVSANSGTYSRIMTGIYRSPPIIALQSIAHWHGLTMIDLYNVGVQAEAERLSQETAAAQSPAKLRRAV